MPVLDCLMAPGQSTQHCENPAATSTPGTGGEPFDELMTRALSPNETAVVPDEQKINKFPSHPAHRQLQTDMVETEVTLHNFCETGGIRLQIADNTSESNSADDKPEATASAQSEASETSQSEIAVLPGILIPLIPALPTMTFPQFMPTGEKPTPVTAETTPTAMASVLAETAVKPETDAALAVTTGKSISAGTTDLNTNPSSAESIHQLQTVAPLQEKPVPTVKDLSAGKTSPTETDTANKQIFSEAKLVSEAKDAEVTSEDVAAPATVPETPTEAPANSLSKAKDAKLKTLAPAQPETHGTAVAKLYSSMNKPEKTTKAADTTEKVLPGNADLAAKEKILPTAAALTGESNSQISASTKEYLPMQATAAASGIATVALEDLRSKTLERTHDMVALHAIRLSDTKTDTFHVVIKPGAGLQLSLDLQQGSDGISAQVKLERGDFGQLNQHWPELQQRLEERGIRLAPLTGSENSFTCSGNNSHEFRQPQREFASPDPIETSAFAEFALASSILQPITSSAFFVSPGRGWESWA